VKPDISPIQQEVINALVDIIKKYDHLPDYPLGTDFPNVFGFVPKSKFPFCQLSLRFMVDLQGQVSVYPIQYTSRNHEQLYRNVDVLIRTFIEIQQEMDNELHPSN
jgi:hypothetical protein